jgi:hypothetical protein
VVRCSAGRVAAFGRRFRRPLESRERGPIAQLVERLAGSQEVRGSNPRGSTENPATSLRKRTRARGQPSRPSPREGSHGDRAVAGPTWPSRTWRTPSCRRLGRISRRCARWRGGCRSSCSRYRRLGRRTSDHMALISGAGRSSSPAPATLDHGDRRGRARCHVCGRSLRV